MLAGQSEWSDQEIVGVNPTVGRGYLFSGGPHCSARLRIGNDGLPSIIGKIPTQFFLDFYLVLLS
jgi:hypothetical protein